MTNSKTENTRGGRSKRRKTCGGKTRRRMRGGSGYLMPASVTDSFTHGDYAGGQTSPVSSVGSYQPNVSLAQSGGRSKKRGRKYRGGSLPPLSPEELAPVQAPAQTGGKHKGGYMAELMQAAIVPFGLVGLNHYARQQSGKRPYLGKSRLSKRLSARRRR